MFPSLLGSTSAFFFPIVSEIGTLFQIMPDNTESILNFGANGNAPTNTSLNVQYSIGGGGPWMTAYQNVYPLNGLPIPNDASPFLGPYYDNNFFRYRWENTTLGYVGPWQTLAGSTTKTRWDVTLAPIAPTAITSAVVFDLGVGLANGVDVTLTHSLAESDNYSYTGIFIETTALVSGFPLTVGAYFTGWGASVGASQVYRIVFGFGIAPSVVTYTRSRYYVLGNPLPGILGHPATL